ncbi:hypothetical protein H1235_15350 [Pseudoxanthomonas sp. NC8]|nr:hypothetical protein H1235_15350 [Pseudoxanthomonas sp. NC8]
MSRHPSATRHPYAWALAGVLLGAGAVLAAQKSIGPGDHAIAASASAPVPGPKQAGAAHERFIAPLDRQADTGEVSIASTQLPFRTDTFRIAWLPATTPATRSSRSFAPPPARPLAYHWSVEGIGNPEEFYADLHGHAPPAPGYREASYRRGGGLQDSGSFTTPFDGIHGWLFKNDSAGAATVTLQVAGFYEPVTAAELAQIERQIETLATP